MEKNRKDKRALNASSKTEKNTVSEINYSLNRLNRQMEMTERKKVSEPEDRSIKIIQPAHAQRDKNIFFCKMN